MGVAMRFFQVQVAGLLASTCGAGERPKQPFPERPLCGDYNSKTRAENSPQTKGNSHPCRACQYFRLLDNCSETGLILGSVPCQLCAWKLRSPRASRCKQCSLGISFPNVCM